MTIPKALKSAAKWLISQGFANVTADGSLVLSSACFQTKTTLSHPEVVKDPEDDFENSIWGLRRKLCRQGWRPGEKARLCSASEMLYNPGIASKDYLCLLLHRSSGYNVRLIYLIDHLISLHSKRGPGASNFNFNKCPEKPFLNLGVLSILKELKAFKRHLKHLKRQLKASDDNFIKKGYFKK